MALFVIAWHVLLAWTTAHRQASVDGDACACHNAATTVTQMGRDPQEAGLGRAAVPPRDRAWPDRREGAAIQHVDRLSSMTDRQGSADGSSASGQLLPSVAS